MVSRNQILQRRGLKWRFLWKVLALKIKVERLAETCPDYNLGLLGIRGSQHRQREHGGQIEGSLSCARQGNHEIVHPARQDVDRKLREVEALKRYGRFPLVLAGYTFRPCGRIRTVSLSLKGGACFLRIGGSHTLA